MKNRLFAIAIALLFVFAILAIFSYISNKFGEKNAIDLLFICNFLFLSFPIFKNGVKTSDFKWHKIKNGKFENGGVALVYFFINGIFWAVILYCRS